jgi:hypothetical protein
MRTKTMLLSALLGAIGSVSAMAQNVYSLNAVGYINVTAPVGFSIISCPLFTSDPSNTVGTLFPNGANQLKGSAVYQYNTATGFYNSDQASTKLANNNGYTNGWEFGGTITVLPGQAVFFDNNTAAPVTFTFVGTVPSGSLTNPIVTGFNLIGSILPASGDLVTNSLTSFTNPVSGDTVYFYDNASGFYDSYGYTKKNGWQSSGSAADPSVPTVGEGFFYNTASAGISWVENYSVSQ